MGEGDVGTPIPALLAIYIALAYVSLFMPGSW